MARHKVPKLKVPSLQHLARVWRPDAQATAGELVKLAINTPVFSYTQFHSICRTLLQKAMDYEQAVQCIGRIKRKYVRDIYQPLLPLVDGYFSPIKVDYVVDVMPRQYALGQDLIVPFHPTLLYGDCGTQVIPWFSFWKSNPVTGERLSLFATIANEILKLDGDLEDVRFEILDFSAPPKCSERTLRITQLSDISLLSEGEALEMLSIFAEGYRLASLALQRIKSENIPFESVVQQARQLNLRFD